MYEFPVITWACIQCNCDLKSKLAAHLEVKVPLGGRGKWGIENKCPFVHKGILLFSFSWSNIEYHGLSKTGTMLLGSLKMEFHSALQHLLRPQADLVSLPTLSAPPRPLCSQRERVFAAGKRFIQICRIIYSCSSEERCQSQSLHHPDPFKGDPFSS